MNVYKLYPRDKGRYPARKIEKDQFESDTKKRCPWYQDDSQGETGQYAVCPACDNPIQIIGLYKRRKNSPKPYGKHYGKNISGLAVHCQEQYDCCPYANPDIHKDRTKCRDANDPKGRELLQLLHEQFDRIIQIIRNVTDIQISPVLAEKMLRRFLSEKGHLYIGTNECNLPWMFAYFSDSQNLYGQFLKEGTELRRSIEKINKNFITDKGQVKSANEIIDIHFCFTCLSINDSSEETILFEVLLGKKNIPIYKKHITVDPVSFSNLCNSPPERAYRNQNLLGIAAKFINETGLLLHP